LTPAGFVKTATGAGGLLSTEAFGANTYIPCSSGTGFSYSPNLTFSGTALVVTGTGQFSYVGIGTMPNAIQGLTLSYAASGATIKGASVGVTNNRNSSFASTITTGIDFNSIFQPLSPTGNRTCGAVHGGTGQAVCSVEANANYNTIVTNARAFYGSIIAQEAGGGTGVANIGTATTFYAAATSKGSGTITTAYAFYDAGQIAATTNWGCAINTQSYFNANVSIGKNTAPTVALDVTGACKISTTHTVTGAFGCNGATAQTAYASGGAAGGTPTLATGYGFVSAAEMNSFTTLVANIRLALINNGVMS
jgi:hypothetical protein